MTEFKESVLTSKVNISILQCPFWTVLDRDQRFLFNWSTYGNKFSSSGSFISVPSENHLLCFYLLLSLLYYFLGAVTFQSSSGSFPSSRRHRGLVSFFHIHNMRCKAHSLVTELGLLQQVGVVGHVLPNILELLASLFSYLRTGTVWFLFIEESKNPAT